MSAPQNRALKLNKIFNGIIHGGTKLIPQSAPLFLEAICLQEEPVHCISKIISSKMGLDSVQASMRFDLSPTFLNGSGCSFLQYIQAPELQNISGGDFLNQVILKIVDPPIFWTAFIGAFRSGSLSEGAQLSFAWLLLQLISLPGEKAMPYREISLDPDILNAILSSSKSETRSIGRKIKHITDTFLTGTNVNSNYGPGGRHDNDFVDFRKISILPTADEIIAVEPAFLRTSDELEDPDTEGTRLAMYLDNQFRLLREDMLFEMKEELQIAFGKKKGHHRGVVFDGLTLLDVFCGSAAKRSKQWGLVFKCHHDLWQMKKDKPKDRKKYLIDNNKILKHQSLACLVVDNDVVAFTTINRDEELLAKSPPIIIVQIEGETTTVNALLRLKTGQSVKLIQIDTAVFSYEPILKALQATKAVPLSPELLFWNKKHELERPPSYLSTMRAVKYIQTGSRRNLQELLNTPRPIILDGSQAASLLTGLTQNVSIIQGPPGERCYCDTSIYSRVHIISQVPESPSSEQYSPKFFMTFRRRQSSSSAIPTMLSISSSKISLILVYLLQAWFV